MQLSGDVLTRAVAAVDQGVAIVNELGTHIKDAAVIIGNEIEKVGPLAAGFAAAAWNSIKGFFNCLSESISLCHMLILGRCLGAF